MHAQVVSPEQFGRTGIPRVTDQNVEEIFIGVKHTGDGTGEPMCLHQNSRRPSHGSIAHDRANGGDLAVSLQQRFMNPGHGENRPDACHRIAGRNEDGVS